MYFIFVIPTNLFVLQSTDGIQDMANCRWHD